MAQLHKIISGFQWTGLGVLAYLFLLIAIAHLLTKAIFLLDWLGIPIFAAAGLALLWLSITTPKDKPVRSVIYAITAAVAFWGIVEVVQHLLDVHMF